MYETTLTISLRPPFSLVMTVWVLGMRTKNNIDRFKDHTYSRILSLNNAPVELTIKQINASGQQLEIKLRSHNKLSDEQQNNIKRLVSIMFGTRVNMKPFYALAANDPALSQLVEQFYGMRPTRYPTIFEALINAIACQQVSLDAGIATLN